MGGSDLALVLEAITQLDNELTSLDRQAHTPDGRTPEANLAMLRALLGRALARSRDLRARIVESAITVQSLERREAALHARTIVVVLQLAELKGAEHELPLSFWSAERSFDSVSAVSRFICSSIGRVNASYLGARRVIAAEDHEGLALALASAEATLDAIGHDAALACFIAAGASVRSVRFRVACRTMGILLGVPLAPEVNPWRPSSKHHSS